MILIIHKIVALLLSLIDCRLQTDWVNLSLIGQLSVNTQTWMVWNSFILYCSKFGASQVSGSNLNYYIFRSKWFETHCAPAWSLAWPTFCAQSCTAHQMEIFAQEFEPSNSFLWLNLRSLDHDLTKLTKIWFSKPIIYVKSQFYDFLFCFC